jgi:O-antigen/teichoic acid export membrane protein
LATAETTSRTRLAQRNPLPEGTLSVGAGLLVSGLSIYGFFAIAGRVLSDAEFAPVSQLWFATFILAPGFFLPLEQEVGRALAHRRALGQGGLPVVRRAGGLAIGLAVLVDLGLLAASPFLINEFFSGKWGLVPALLLAFTAYAAAFFMRGVFSGSGRFGGYGTLLGADGLVRVLCCAVLAAAGIATAGPYGLLVGIPPLVGIALALRMSPLRERLADGPEASWSELTPNLGWLLAASLPSAALINAGPIAANLLADDSQEALVSNFSKGIFVARVPLFLFQAVQAALLPKLARLAAAGELTEFRRGFRKLLGVVVGVAALGTVGAFLIGPFAVKLFDATLDRRTITLLALSSGLYMIATAIAQAVIALRGHHQVAFGWIAGFATFLAVTVISGHDLLLRVELGMIAGTAVPMVWFAVVLAYRIRAGAEPDEESIVEALHDIPMEP